MPKTMPGFLLVAGVVMFVFSLFRGPIKAKSIELPALGNGARLALGAVGVIFITYSLWLYLIYSPGQLPLMAPPEATPAVSPTPTAVPR